MHFKGGKDRPRSHLHSAYGNVRAVASDTHIPLLQLRQVLMLGCALFRGAGKVCQT